MQSGFHLYQVERGREDGENYANPLFHLANTGLLLFPYTLNPIPSTLSGRRAIRPHLAPKAQMSNDAVRLVVFFALVIGNWSLICHW